MNILRGIVQCFSLSPYEVNSIVTKKTEMLLNICMKYSYQTEEGLKNFYQN